MMEKKETIPQRSSLMPQKNQASGAGGANTEKALVERLYLRHPNFMPREPLSDDVKRLVIKHMADTDPRRGFVACCRTDIRRAVLAYAYLSLSNSIGDRVTVTCLNAYRLVQIHFKDLDEDNENRPDWAADVLSLHMGYSEPPNKYLSQLVCYRMELAADRGSLRRQDKPGLSRIGQAFWLYYKGGSWEFNQQFSAIVGKAKELHMPIVELPSADTCAPIKNSPGADETTFLGSTEITDEEI